MERWIRVVICTSSPAPNTTNRDIDWHRFFLLVSMTMKAVITPETWSCHVGRRLLSTPAFLDRKSRRQWSYMSDWHTLTVENGIDDWSSVRVARIFWSVLFIALLNHRIVSSIDRLGCRKRVVVNAVPILLNFDKLKCNEPLCVYVSKLLLQVILDSLVDYWFSCFPRCFPFWSRFRQQWGAWVNSEWAETNVRDMIHRWNCAVRIELVVHCVLFFFLLRLLHLGFQWSIGNIVHEHLWAWVVSNELGLSVQSTDPAWCSLQKKSMFQLHWRWSLQRRKLYCLSLPQDS